MKLRLTLAAAAMALTTSACRTVTILADGSQNPRGTPDHEESYGFGLGGIVGEKTIDVEKICKDSKVAKIQTTETAGDQILTIVTLGLYTPRTARVWCEEEE